MSYHAETYEDSDKPWFHKKSLWITAAAILCLLAAGIGILSYVRMSQIPDIGGDLTLEADSDTRIYVGDKLVGTDKVTFTWTELFGDEKHPPLAIEMPAPGSPVTAETLSYAGAKFLLSGTSSSGGVREATYSSEQHLIRRSDGALDHVFVIILDCHLDRPRRYVVPIRIRKGKPSTTYFFEAGSSTSVSSLPAFMKAFGRSPAEIKIGRKFGPTSPPNQFPGEAEEIKSKGLWEPAAEK
jgi:hypothetical protein